ncbi:unnamed protein product [marine sediment metagenome]|uniref:Uncharacterized protein n=1 Tax=marine sediment metagenome TaxID=412755 RepID=X0Z642_9ZZZZ
MKMDFGQMELKDLQGLRDKSRGNQLKEVKTAIDNLFLPPKPRKKRKSKEKRRFSQNY